MLPESLANDRAGLPAATISAGEGRRAASGDERRASDAAPRRLRARRAAVARARCASLREDDQRPRGADDRQRRRAAPPSPSTRSASARSAARRGGRSRPRRSAGRARVSGAVFGSVIMNARKMNTSGESDEHLPEVAVRDRTEVPVRGERVAAQRQDPERARERDPEDDRDREQCRPASARRARRRRSRSSTITSAGDSGPHQNWSGSTRVRPRITNASTRAKFDGLKMCLPRNLIRYFDAIATAATARVDPDAVEATTSRRACVPGMRMMNAIPLPVSIALAGQMITRFCRNVTTTSISRAGEDRASRSAGIESRKWNSISPSTYRTDERRRDVKPRVLRRRQRSPDTRRRDAKRTSALRPLAQADLVARSPRAGVRASRCR